MTTREDALIAEIDLTLDYFYEEFPKPAHDQVWCDPISPYAGGISPNDLLEIRAALSAPPDDDVDTIWEAWHEINAICARDGAPVGVCQNYFANLKDRLKNMLPEEYKNPWHPIYVRKNRNHLQPHTREG